MPLLQVCHCVCAQDERSNHRADHGCACVCLAGKVNMHKVRWEPISDAQHLENFRVLQDAFAKAGVQRVRRDSPSMHHDWHTHELVHAAAAASELSLMH